MSHNTFSLKAKFSEIRPVNPEFSLAKVVVMTYGGNRNNSYMSKETVENALPSIFGVPIICEYFEEKEDFGSHGGRIIIDDNGMKFERTTYPVGFVSSDATYSWETFDDGEYLVLDGCYLWTGRYPEASILLDESRPQSMEISQIQGFVNKDKQFQIDEFVFSALCILGSDVTPCFQSAQISAYSLSDKDEFKQQIKEMMSELKFSLEGGNTVTKATQTAEFSWSSEQLENELRRLLSTQLTTDNWGYTYPEFWFVDYLPDESIVIAYDGEDGYLVGFKYTVEGDKVSIDFTVEQRYKVQYVPMDLSPEVDEEEDSIDTFSLLTPEQVEYKLKVEVAKMKQEFELNATETQVETVEDTQIENTETVETEVVDTPVETEIPTETVLNPSEVPVEDYQAQLTDVSKALTELQEQFNLVMPELEQLREFKAEKLRAEREAQEAELFAKFTNQLTEEELAPIREKCSEFSLEEVESQLYIVVGKKLATFSAQKPVTTNTNRASLLTGIGEKPVKTSPYGDVDKYLRK